MAAAEPVFDDRPHLRELLGHGNGLTEVDGIASGTEDLLTTPPKPLLGGEMGDWWPCVIADASKQDDQFPPESLAVYSPDGVSATSYYDDPEQTARPAIEIVPHTIPGDPIPLDSFDKPSGKATLYDVTSLGTLGGAWSKAEDLNSRGTVVGSAATSDGERHAFLWNKSGEMQDLGTLGGRWSTAYAVNDSDVVVGSAETQNGRRHAFIWHRGEGMTELGTLGGASSAALAINADEVVVGAGETADGTRRAFVWTYQDGMRPLANESTIAWDVNAAGQAVGEARDPQGRSHPVRWSNSGTSVRLETGGSKAVASGINSLGRAVGTIWSADGSRQAFFCDSVGPQQVPGLADRESSASGINSNGAIVGWVKDGGTDARRAFMWRNDIGLLTLGTIGGPESAAVAVNDDYYAAGWAINEEGETRAVLWSPVEVYGFIGALDGSRRPGVDPLGLWLERADIALPLGGLLFLRTDGYSPTAVAGGSTGGIDETLVNAPEPPGMIVPEPGSFAVISIISAGGLLLNRRIRKHTRKNNDIA